MAQGWCDAEISREIGYIQRYWSRIRRESPLFQEYLYSCRDVAQAFYATSLERLYNGAVDRKLERILLRQQHRLANRRARRGKAASNCFTAASATPSNDRGARSDAEIRQLTTELQREQAKVRVQASDGTAGRRRF